MDAKFVMNKKYFGAWLAIVLKLVSMLLLVALPVISVLAAPAVSGDGSMSVNLSSVAYGSTNTFVFTFTATGDFGDGSQVELDIPVGWTAPTIAPGAGRVTVANVTCASLPDPLGGITGQKIFIDMVECLTGQSFRITYVGGPAPGVSGTAYTFDTLTDAGSGADLTPIAASPEVTVTPAILTVTGITADDKDYDTNTAATVNAVGATLVGNLDGGNVVLDATSVAGAFTPDGNVGNNKTVQISGLTITGSAIGNYTLTQPTTTANITAKELTVTGITADDKAYDTNTAATVNAVGATLVGNLDGGNVVLDATSVAGAFTPDGNVGNNKTVQISGLIITGSAIGNYTLTQPTTTASITAKSITVIVDPGQTKVFSRADPTFTYTCSDPAVSFTGALDRVAGEAVGVYAIGLGDLAVVGNNYIIFTFVPANFTITPDVVSPVAILITRVGTAFTSAASVDFTVMFSEAVINVDTADFSLAVTAITGEAVTGVIGGPTIYTVTVNTGSGSGTIRLDVPANNVSITDPAGNPLANLPYITGEMYTVIKVYKLFLPLLLR